MSGAIVAKAINETIGTPEFKGLDRVLAELLQQNNDNIERILTDFTANLEAKGLVASDDVLYVAAQQKTRHTQVGAYEEKVISNITFRTKGSIKVGVNYIVSVFETERMELKITLNNETIYSGRKTESNYISEIIKIKKGDVFKAILRHTANTTEGGNIGYTITINAKDVNLTGIEENDI